MNGLNSGHGTSKRPSIGSPGPGLATSRKHLELQHGRPMVCHHCHAHCPLPIAHGKRREYSTYRYSPLIQRGCAVCSGRRNSPLRRQSTNNNATGGKDFWQSTEVLLLYSTGTRREWKRPRERQVLEHVTKLCCYTHVSSQKSITLQRTLSLGLLCSCGARLQVSFWS
jgi:hypothetical protein